MKRAVREEIEGNVCSQQIPLVEFLKTGHSLLQVRDSRVAALSDSTYLPTDACRSCLCYSLRPRGR